MRLARQMRRNRQSVADPVTARAVPDLGIPGARGRPHRDLVPQETRKSVLAFPVNRVGKPKPPLVEPARPFRRVIMETQASIRRREEIDMMRQCEPGAAQAITNLGEKVAQCGLILRLHDVQRKYVRGTE